jgi:catechol 2,3-dioxygenase-like lactoylglutathione lyase family enzyme
MIDRIDHVVITVADLETTLAFYERVLGMSRIVDPGRPTALGFGHQKINVHQHDRRFAPFARCPMPGSADLCLITSLPLDTFRGHLAREQVPIELGPVPRTGAIGPMTSLYIRDADGNLIEIAAYPGES